MIVLGLDPGSRHTGYGVIRSAAGRTELMAAGRLSPPGSDCLALRLTWLFSRVEALVAEFRPDVAAVESVFHGPNARSLIVLAQARGVIFAALGRHGLEPGEFSPAEVKRAVTGAGRADKQQVARMVYVLLGRRPERAASDVTDALAVALCGASSAQRDRAVAGT